MCCLSQKESIGFHRGCINHLHITLRYIGYTCYSSLYIGWSICETEDKSQLNSGMLTQYGVVEDSKFLDITMHVVRREPFF